MSLDLTALELERQRRAARKEDREALVRPMRAWALLNTAGFLTVGYFGSDAVFWKFTAVVFVIQVGMWRIQQR